MNGWSVRCSQWTVHNTCYEELVSVACFVTRHMFLHAVFATYLFSQITQTPEYSYVEILKF